MKARIVFSVLALLVFSTSEAAERRWVLRFHGAVVQSSGSGVSTASPGATFRVDGDTTTGFGVGAEYRISDRVGLEVSTLFAALEIGSRASAKGSSLVESLELSMMPWMLSVPIHVRAGPRTEFFFAPTLGYVEYYDVRSTLGSWLAVTDVEVGADTAYGAAVGLDTDLGSGRHWAFSAGLRFMKTSAGGADVDPLIVTVGLAYRF